MNRKTHLTTEQTVAVSNWLVAHKSELESEGKTALEILPRIEVALKCNPSSVAVLRIATAAGIRLPAVKPQTPRMHKTTVVARAIVELYHRLGEEPDEELVSIANPTLPHRKEGN